MKILTFALVVVLYLFCGSTFTTVYKRLEVLEKNGQDHIERIDILRNDLTKLENDLRLSDSIHTSFYFQQEKVLREKCADLRSAREVIYDRCVSEHPGLFGK